MNNHKLAQAFSFILYMVLTSFNVQSTIITTDEVLFYSMYKNPTESIDFTLLKDGSTYFDVAVTNPLITGATHPGASEGFYAVRENGWSDNFLFRTTNGSLFHTATRWDGNSIGINSIFTPRFSIYSLNVSVIALNISSDTYSGFLGIIPESNTGNHYELIYPSMRIHQFKSGFSTVANVSEPNTFIILAFALVVFLANKTPYKRRLSV